MDIKLAPYKFALKSSISTRNNFLDTNLVIFHWLPRSQNQGNWWLLCFSKHFPSSITVHRLDRVKMDHFVLTFRPKEESSGK